VGFFLEGVEEVLEEDVRVLDAVGVLPDDPDHGGLGLGLVQRVEVLAEGGDDGLVLVGVFAEDVTDDDGCLLDDVGDLCADEGEKGADAQLSCWRDLDGQLADGAYRLADEVNINLCGVPGEVSKQSCISDMNELTRRALSEPP
jgi:hypothetical protein